MIQIPVDCAVSMLQKRMQKSTASTGGHYSKSKSKSQRASQKSKIGANEDVVVAYGTSDSEICIFSPAEGKPAAYLTGGHERGIYDFKFSQHSPQEAWSIGGDSTLVQWDLSSNKPLRFVLVKRSTSLHH